MAFYEDSLIINIFIIILIFCYTLIYFLPTMIGYWKDKYNKNSILIINLLTGWSIIGWIVSVMMLAFTKDDDINKKNTKYCGELIGEKHNKKENEIKILMNFIFSVYSFWVCFIPIYGGIIATCSTIMSIKANELCKIKRKIITAGLIISAISAVIGTIISGVFCGGMIFTYNI